MGNFGLWRKLIIEFLLCMISAVILTVMSLTYM